MGYTHYWYREKEIDQKTFKDIVDDFKRCLPTFKKLGIKLAGPHGIGKPILDDNMINFNGLSKCGHTIDESISIPWPTDDASGIAKPGENVKKGYWMAGALLQKRTCNGDCSYESFTFPRVIDDDTIPCEEISSYYSDGTPIYNDKNIVGKYFACCKTAFRPYDIAVITCLIIAKHYLNNKIIIRSDGTLFLWKDGIDICKKVLKYGKDFQLDQ